MPKMKNILERCKCCLEEVELKDMWTEYYTEGEKEVYGLMLTDCFGLAWQEPTDNMKEHICNSCVSRLRDAINFKKEILCSEQMLLEQIKKESSDEIDDDVKQENDFEMETEYLDFSVESDDQETNTIDIKPDPDNSKIVEVKPTTDKKIKKYTQEEFKNCIEEIRNKKITRKEAALKYNIPRQTITSWLSRHPVINDVTIRKVVNKNVKKYTQKDLDKCLEEVRNKTMSQLRAAAVYNIPRTTIAAAIARSKIKSKLKEKPISKEADIKLNINIVNTPIGDEAQKIADNITTLLVNTNATPIRNHQDFGYTCCYCPQACANAGDLKEHTLTKHDVEEKKRFIKGKRVRHYVTKLDITNLKCNICNNNVDNLEDMVRHLKDHGEKIHQDVNNQIIPLKFEDHLLRCIVCNRVFNTLKRLLEHMNSHSKNFVCDVCGSGYINRNTFVHHYKSHSKGVFPCEHCSKVFETKLRKRNHVLSVHVHNQKTLKCGFCGEKFTSSYSKSKHVAAAHGIVTSAKDLECQVCHKVCKSLGALRVHTKRIHLQERRYSCEDCNMKFFTKGELVNHALKHTGVREFQCEVCKKSYGKKWTLREHMRIHANDRRFKCEHCDMAFIQKCSLIGHVKSRHGGAV